MMAYSTPSHWAARAPSSPFISLPMWSCRPKDCKYEFFKLTGAEQANRGFVKLTDQFQIAENGAVAGVVDAHARLGVKDKAQGLPAEVISVRGAAEGSVVAFDSPHADAARVALATPGQGAHKRRVGALLCQEDSHLWSAHYRAIEAH